MTDGSATSATDRARIEAVWGDPASWDAEGRGWTSLDAIRRMINRRVTGDPSKPPLTWFFERADTAGRLPFARALVLACGGGALERDLARSGLVREIVAIDISERALASARATAASEGLDGIVYRQADMNDLRLGDGPFDVVFGAGAIHHCAALEGLLAALARLMAPGGWLYVDDYVGPSRFQWTRAQLAHTNRLQAILPESFLRTRSGHVRRRFDRLSVADMIAFDPSEAARSAEIPGLVRQHFEIVAERGYGGALLHLVLGHIAQNFETATGARYVARLIEAETDLMRAGILPDDFRVIIARAHPTR